jgi:hypothetical protein
MLDLLFLFDDFDGSYSRVKLLSGYVDLAGLCDLVRMFLERLHEPVQEQTLRCLLDVEVVSV